MDNKELLVTTFSPDDTEVHFLIISLKGSGSIELKGTCGIAEIFRELCLVFCSSTSDDGKIISECIYEVSDALKEKVFCFVNKFSHNFPQLHKLRQLFEKLNVGNYIFTLPSKEYVRFDTQEFNNICMMLESIESKISIEDLLARYDNTFGNVTSTYDIICGGGDRAYFIGEADKKKRVCRYCGKSDPIVSFKKKGHTISEALGNKTMITRDECDDCNEKFGSGIEESIIEYLNLHRVFFAIKGKSGVPSLQGENYTICLKDGKLDFKFWIPDEYAHLYIGGIDKNYPPRQIPLVSNKKIIVQDIYRCIVKYAVGLLPSNMLSKFERTIKWIKKDFDAECLPKVAILTTYNFFDRHPSILVYLQKANNDNLPFAVCELHFACFVIVAIIPTFEQKSFSEESDYLEFWNSFHYSKTRNWIFNNFLGNTPKKLVVSFNLEQHKATPETF